MVNPKWSDPVSFCHQKFDYIIVGAGTAGAVVAARLSEDPDVVIGLIETGLEVSDKASIDHPGKYAANFNTDVDYAYKTTPQEGANGRKIDVPRGRGLGGSSLLNFMLWMRPNRQDLDEWSDFGNDGWSFEEMKPYYKKAEQVEQPLMNEQQKYRFDLNKTENGLEGPVKISFCKDVCLTALPFYDALDELKIPISHAPLSGDHTGVFTALSNIDPKTGKRAHSARAYIFPNSERANLHILTGATVDEVILEKETEKWSAKGVKLTHGSNKFTVLAARETLICAGSYSSPLLLERSGIGRPEVLKGLGVPVKIPNNNVGENLQDHCMVAVVYELGDSEPGIQDLLDDVHEAKADAQLAINHSTNDVEAMVGWTVAYLKLNDFVSHDKLQQTLSTHSQESPRFESIMSKYSPTYVHGQVEYIPMVGNFAPGFNHDPHKKYMTILQVVQHAFSAGTVHTSFADNKTDLVSDQPVINPKIFEKRTGGINDLKLHALALENVLEKIEATTPMKKFIKERVWPPTTAVTDDSWESWIRDNVSFDWHPVGTCGMGGRGGAETGVVDERLRVYDVSNLRVIDASIMPSIVNAHPMATVFAIGEKASDMIKADWASV